MSARFIGCGRNGSYGILLLVVVSRPYYSLASCKMGHSTNYANELYGHEMATNKKQAGYLECLRFYAYMARV